MRLFVRVLIACLFVAGGASAQAPDAACRPSPGEKPVHEALLTHFQVVEGTVDVRPFDRIQPAEREEPAVGEAVADFNARNARLCPATDGPVPGLSLIAGPHRTRLSRVGFDGAGTTAFAEITMIGGPEIGSGHFVVLKRKGPTWTVIEDRIYRMF